MTATTKKRKGRPQQLSEDWLRRAAYRYLERFSATEADVVRVLQQKIKRIQASGPDAAACEDETDWNAIAERIAARCVELGLVDDRAFAAARARRLHARGQPVRRIAGALAAKGVAVPDVEDALDALAQETGVCSEVLDIAAAATFARRRRLGPYRRDAHRAADPSQRQKDLAAFARAGFAYAVARRVLDADDEAAVERLLGGTLKTQGRQEE